MKILPSATLMFVLPLIILGLGIATMLVLRLYRPRFAYHWLAAASSSLLAWPLVLLLHLQIPTSVPLLNWQPQEFFTSSPTYQIDTVSWSIALALSSIVLAVILTAVARTSGAAWLTWALCLLLAIEGIQAVLAGNLLTLALTWAPLDFTELIILLLLVRSSSERQLVTFGFSIRLLSLILLVWGMLIASQSGSPLSFASLPAEVNPYLLLAAGLRLVVLPFHLPVHSKAPLQRGLGTQVRLVSVAPGLMLMARAAGIPTPPSAAPYILGLAAIVALLGAIIWAAAKDELEGRPFWILGMGALALASAARGQPQASLAWGLALLLPGALLFLLSARHPRLFFLSVLGLLGISCLPFTPAWQASLLYSPPFEPVLLVFLLAQALLLFGYIRHARRPGPSLTGIERWVWLIYPAGLAVPLIGQWVIAWWGNPPIPSVELPWTGAWSALAAAILAGLLAFGLMRRPALADALQYRIRHATFPGWISPSLWSGYRLVRQLVALVSQVLEGEGGILWTLLLLLLILTYLIQRAA